MTGFYQRMKTFTVKRIILHYDFLLALVLTFGFILYDVEIGFNQTTFTTMLSDISFASINIATIILAGFAIIVSFADDGFVAMLKRLNVYSNIIFVFEYTTINAIFCFLLSLFLKDIHFNTHLMYLLCFLFIYLLFSLISLIMFISFYGMKKSEYSDIVHNGEPPSQRRESLR